MGAAIAKRLAQEGAAVTVADLDGAAAERVAAEITGEGGRAVAQQVDVSKRDLVRAMVSAAVEAFGGVDVIFNNAGFNRPMHLLDVTEENWRSIMDVNALGVLLCTQEAARQMIKQGRGGKIVNTTSIAGRQGYPSFAPYCASKFAVIALTQATARGLAEHDITANAFAPGVVATPCGNGWTRTCGRSATRPNQVRPWQTSPRPSSGGARRKRRTSPASPVPRLSRLGLHDGAGDDDRRRNGPCLRPPAEICTLSARHETCGPLRSPRQETTGDGPYGARAHPHGAADQWAEPS